MVVDTPHEPDIDEEWKIPQPRFGLEEIETYYLSFWEKRTIKEEAWIDVNYFKECSIKRGLLKLADMANDHNSQLVKVAKFIPSMIQHGIKVALKPLVEMLGIDLYLLEIASESPILEMSPPDDWCVGISLTKSAATKEIQEEEKP
ncbi:hypothetical protein HAX54_030246 [Datura stramonium]|uniref:Uncharacterized protein n=1 Tax=Datura stramonium TaxID=4076 RepID=A0ABS8V8D3_DATST|nr:hypothetical protein [Datura stramonium]